MDTHNVLENDTGISRIDQKLFKLESFLNSVAGIVILVVMLMSVANILARKVFNFPLYGFIDWMVMAVPVMAFLGLSFCQRLGGHIRMDILIGKFRGRTLWTIEFITTVLMTLVVAVLIYGSWDHAARALRIGDSTPVAYLPTWPVKAVVTLGFSLLVVRLIIQLAAYFKAMVGDDPQPAAVPFILDAAEQASAEAETVHSDAIDAEAIQSTEKDQ